MLGVRLVAFPNRPGTRVRAWMRPPRFRAKKFSTCTRSPTARGSSHASHSPWDDVAFSSSEGDRHLGIRPVSQLNTWPVVSPVNASRRPSRDAAHHSGSGRMAGPYPVGDFHLLFFASFPGALRNGSKATVRRCPRFFRFTLDVRRFKSMRSKADTGQASLREFMDTARSPYPSGSRFRVLPAGSFVDWRFSVRARRANSRTVE